MNARRFALALAAALVAMPSPLLAQAGQGVPTPSDAPTVDNPPPVIAPTPDVHGRAGGGEQQLHGSDNASPGAGGTSSTGGSIGNTGSMGSSSTGGQPAVPPAAPASGQ